MSEQPSLAEAAQAACDALRRHAEACEQDPEDSTAVMPALVDLREAMAAYSRLLAESTGWAPPLADLHGDPPWEADDEEEGGGAAPGEGGGNVPWIMVTSTTVLRVEDAEAFMDLARSRLGREVESPEQAARLLCEVDGWNPSEYPGESFAVTQRDVDSCLS